MDIRIAGYQVNRVSGEQEIREKVINKGFEMTPLEYKTL